MQRCARGGGQLAEAAASGEPGPAARPTATLEELGDQGSNGRRSGDRAPRERLGHTGPVVSPRPAHVTILLSIRDGERWLDELLASVRNQSHDEWTLLVRDDGSSDDGLAVVQRHAAADERIRILDDADGTLGPAASFMRLLGQVDHGWFAFCDQDDVWLPEKLAVGLAAAAGAPRCSLVVTDAVVVDADGRELAPSAFAVHGYREPLTIGRLLVNNVAIGATVMGDVDLAVAATAAAPDGPPVMHDWWVALVAAYHGSVIVEPAPTVRWRRHGHTVTGSTPVTLRGRMRRRLSSLERSVTAARTLQVSGITPVDAATGRAVAALASVDPRSPSVSQLWTARQAGVRAWSASAQAGLVAAVAGRRWAERTLLVLATCFAHVK